MSLGSDPRPGGGVQGAPRSAEDRSERTFTLDQVLMLTSHFGIGAAATHELIDRLDGRGGERWRGDRSES